MTEFYVYQHIRPDTNEVFYVGKGTRPDRALEHAGRSEWWKRIVAKAGGLIVHIVGRFDTEKEAFRVEQALIAHYGRARLCNLTAGGEGHSGFSPTAETREKLRAALSGQRHPNWGKRLSAETCRRKSESMKRSPKNLRGKTLPAWWRDKIRAAKFGLSNPMFGRTGERHPSARRVLDRNTGAIYPSVTAAARAMGLSMQGLHNMLTGFRPNSANAEFC